MEKTYVVHFLDGDVVDTKCNEGVNRSNVEVVEFYKIADDKITKNLTENFLVNMASVKYIRLEQQIEEATE